MDSSQQRAVQALVIGFNRGLAMLANSRRDLCLVEMRRRGTTTTTTTTTIDNGNSSRGKNKNNNNNRLWTAGGVGLPRKMNGAAPSLYLLTSKGPQREGFFGTFKDTELN